MKYSRLGRRYSCSSCCWPCCLTFLFLLATSVFHVTATTAAIKYNYQQQTKQLQLRPQSERQQRQQLLHQHNQQSTYKHVESSNENNTAETISGTILQSAMVIIDDNFDDYNSQRKNKSKSKYSNSEQNIYRESNKKSNKRTTDFPKARTVEAITPTMINIPMVKAVSNETMKLPTAITPKPISASNSVIPRTTTSTTTTTKTPITTVNTTATTKFVVKIVSETAKTTKILRATATMKLLPPIVRAYGKIKMSSLENPEKDTDKDDDNDDDSISRSKSRTRTNRSNGKSEKASLSKNIRSTDINNSTMLLYQQQSSTSEQALSQPKLQEQQETQTVQSDKRQTTSLANVTPLVVINRGTTPSALLRLMSEEQQKQEQQHFASQYAAPLSHTIAYRRERRQEPTAEEQVDKCRTFLESDDNKNVINSPDYPNDYPKNINCTRVIVAPKGQIIRLDFRNSFHIEDKEECKFDYLEIRDGQYGFSNLIGKYCGTDFPPEITSKERYLWLHFHSDESIEYSGFTAVYEFMDRSRETPSTDLNCTIEKSGVEGWVNSSDIPADIKKTAEDNKIPLDCMWRIQVNDTWKIQIKFLEFKLVRPNDCEGNFLDIFPEETTMPRRLKNFCGSAGEGIGSETNIIHIRFYAEPSTINSTFGILYTAFRERGSAPNCNEGELDCQDSTCISETLMCNERDNCKFRWDEEPCKKNKKQESSEILIIIIVFGLILGGMILTFLVNCIRKIMRDQKIIRSVPALTDGIYHIDSFILGAPKAAISVGLSNDYATEYEHKHNKDDMNGILQYWTNCNNAYNGQVKQVHHDEDFLNECEGSCYSQSDSNSNTTSNVSSSNNSYNYSRSTRSVGKEKIGYDNNMHDAVLANFDEEALPTEPDDDDEDSSVLEAMEDNKRQTGIKIESKAIAIVAKAESKVATDTETYNSDDSELQNVDTLSGNSITNNVSVGGGVDIDVDGKYYYKNHGYYVNDDEFFFVNSTINDYLGVIMTEHCSPIADSIEACDCKCDGSMAYDCTPPQCEQYQPFGYANQYHLDLDGNVTMSANSRLAICGNSNSSSQTVIAESATSSQSSPLPSATVTSSSSSSSSCETIASAYATYGVDDDVQQSFEDMKTKELYTIPSPPPPPTLSLPFLKHSRTTSNILCGTAGPRKSNRISPMPEAVNNYRYPCCLVSDFPSA